MEHRATGDAKRRRLTAPLSSRYSCSRQVTLTINKHLANIYEEGELKRRATISKWK